jgi:putative Mn2+ efflux pump MntP
VVVVVTAAAYPIGTTRAMGPGYVPLALGAILVVLGLGIILVEGRSREPERLDIPGIRPLIWIPAAVLAFALTIRTFGLAPAVFLTAYISTLADREIGVVRAVVLAACLTVASVLVFKWGLGLQMEVWKW